jgi:hypothetical protein
MAKMFEKQIDKEGKNSSEKCNRPHVTHCTGT